MSASEDISDLAVVYFEQRPALARFFKARLGQHVEVDDLLQDLYLKIQAAPKVDVREPKAYLYRLAANLMRDRRRSGMRAAARDANWSTIHRGQGDIDDAPSAEAIVDARLRLVAVASTLERLPEKTRVVFHLHKFEELSYSEVADRLGVSKSSVEKHMMTALKALTERSKP